MIKRLETLTSPIAGHQRGLNKISDIIPRLIQQHEGQTQLTQARQKEAEAKQAAMDDAAMIRQAEAAFFGTGSETPNLAPQLPQVPVAAKATITPTHAVQQSFGW